MIEWLRSRSQARRAKKTAAAVWNELHTNRLLSMAMEIASSIDRAGEHPQTDRVAQSVYVSGHYPALSTMLYAPEVAEVGGQDINQAIATLELFANEATSADLQLATYIWVFTLRGYVDGRFRYPMSRIWIALQASPEYVDGTVPEYVREWIAYKY